MQDPYVIMNTGFKNSRDSGALSGYQIDIRVPYYRGIFLSSVHSLELAVDGQAIAPESLRIRVSGRTFTMAQMLEADSVRWGFGDPATLFVARPGGLKPGIHEVRVAIVIRKSYLPAQDPEHLYEEFPGLWQNGKYSTFIEGPTVVTRRMTLVQ
ncbi:MAG: hypothetical protein JSS24_05875 [Proteobacteria bacterium]|nr:hypothetical protein [Pseudomonadota bacterium]